MTTALGGKGANQAVAAARLGAVTGLRTQFVCQFGDDVHAARLEQILTDNGCELGACGRASHCPSGTGLVLLEADGSVGAIVVGGSNSMWTADAASALAEHVRGASALLLQREVPEEVNEVLAEVAEAAGVPVLQDVGGEERPISDALLRRLTYICPNESELGRLTGMPTHTLPLALAAARALQSRGSRNVLVTLGGRGSLLLTADDTVLEQGPCPVPGGTVVDETGAGDAFRAAFAVALVEGHLPADCLRFAAAAGAHAVAVMGAEPSLPNREAVDALVAAGGCAESVVPPPSAPTEAPTPPPAAGSSAPLGATGTAIGGGAAVAGSHAGGATGGAGAVGSAGGRPPALHGASPDGFPLQFASRLNSMKDRPDLWEGPHDVLGWVQRQGTVAGLSLVDFNYPQHLKGKTAGEVRAALEGAGLKAGAIALRYEKEHQAGAFTHPEEAKRRRAIELTKEGAAWALELGANELIVWSAFDGFDYPIQVDYNVLWQRVVDAFREVCDAYPAVRVSLEFKPTDENTRYFAVPSTGAALLLARDVDRPNFGLTLDIGHMIMAGEHPPQSVAMVGQAGKLFGVQLNDGHAKLGAEDGLVFGSVHNAMALEFLRWLQKVGFDGHFYFDTFPRNEDPVREAEYNIRRVKALWAQAAKLSDAGVDTALAKHDAMGALELMERLAVPTVA